MGALAKALKGKKFKQFPRPLWKGPAVDGITQSLLGGFMACRERFRLRVIEGYAPPDQFHDVLGFGNYWHICEEMFAMGVPWKPALKKEAARDANLYRSQQHQINKWYQIILRMFPIYIKYWSENEDVRNRTPVLSEISFKVPYDLPNGETVLLRGKWDSIDRVGKTKKLWLQENKTKGNPDKEAIEKLLAFDMQTMIYLVALRTACRKGLYGLGKKDTAVGVRYNVIRRPLGGGRHCIRQKKGSKNIRAETSEEYYDRLFGLIEGEQDYFFMRWNSEVSEDELDTFEQTFLVPQLTQLVHWWHWMEENYADPWKVCPKTGVPGGGYHWRHPYGQWNPVDNGRRNDIDEMLDGIPNTRITRNRQLFPEL